MYTAESHKCIMWEVKTGKQLYTFKYIGGDIDIHLSVNSKGDRLIIVANNTLMLYKYHYRRTAGQNRKLSFLFRCVFCER